MKFVNIVVLLNITIKLNIMIEKKTVYLPVKVERHRNHHIFDLNECEGSFIEYCDRATDYYAVVKAQKK